MWLYSFKEFLTKLFFNFYTHFYSFTTSRTKKNGNFIQRKLFAEKGTGR